MSKNTESTYMIQSMCAAIRNLEYVQESERTPEYQEICCKIKEFIEMNCVHKIIFDTVDTGPETSQTIKYCIHCEKTFS